MVFIPPVNIWIQKKKKNQSAFSSYSTSFDSGGVRNLLMCLISNFMQSRLILVLKYKAEPEGGSADLHLYFTDGD